MKMPVPKIKTRFPLVNQLFRDGRKATHDVMKRAEEELEREGLFPEATVAAFLKEATGPTKQRISLFPPRFGQKRNPKKEGDKMNPDVIWPVITFFAGLGIPGSFWILKKYWDSLDAVDKFTFTYIFVASILIGYLALEPLIP